MKWLDRIRGDRLVSSAVAFVLVGATGGVVFSQTPGGDGGEPWADVRALLSNDSRVRDEALSRLEQGKDLGLVAGLNDMLYYHYVVQDEKMAKAIVRLLERLTGDEVGPNPRKGWSEWVGRHDELSPVSGYRNFKAFVFARYDPFFRRFLRDRVALRIRPEEIEWGGVVKDGIPALDNPGFVDAADAEYLNDDDRVFGVFVNGEAKAYPHRIMDWHEMCNDVVGGVPVSLSYCTLCGSGILFEGSHESREDRGAFTFGSSGLLYRSNKLMYDRPTLSLWNNLTGEPVGGRLASSGIRLRVLPMVVSTWREWKRTHATTRVLDVENTGFTRDYRHGPYEEYFSSETTMFPVWLRSDRLETKQKVFTLIVNGQPKAYPIELLREEQVSHDRLGDVDLVLVTDAGSGAVRAYRSGGLRFRRVDAGELAETQTGRRFRLTEDAIVSELESLPRVAGHNAFWFGWYAFYPTTDVYEGAND